MIVGGQRASSLQGEECVIDSRGQPAGKKCHHMVNWWAGTVWHKEEEQMQEETNFAHYGVFWELYFQSFEKGRFSLKMIKKNLVGLGSHCSKYIPNINIKDNRKVVFLHSKQDCLSVCCTIHSLSLCASMARCLLAGASTARWASCWPGALWSSLDWPHTICHWSKAFRRMSTPEKTATCIHSTREFH